jgi:hypothetical protein
MVELPTPCLCPSGALFAHRSRGGYELFNPPATHSASTTCNLTTLWVLCVSDHHFWDVRDHFCRWCSLEFRSCRSLVSNRLAVPLEQFSLSNSLPRLVSLPCADADSQTSSSAHQYLPLLARKLGNCRFVPTRKRLSSTRDSANCFRFASTDDFPLSNHPALTTDASDCSVNDRQISNAVSTRVFLFVSTQIATRVRSCHQSNSRIVTQRCACTHPVRSCNPTKSALRDECKPAAGSTARIANKFGRCLAPLVGN